MRFRGRSDVAVDQEAALSFPRSPTLRSIGEVKHCGSSLDGHALVRRSHSPRHPRCIRPSADPNGIVTPSKCVGGATRVR